MRTPGITGHVTAAEVSGGRSAQDEPGRQSPAPGSVTLSWKEMARQSSPRSPAAGLVCGAPAFPKNGVGGTPKVIKLLYNFGLGDGFFDTNSKNRRGIHQTSMHQRTHSRAKGNLQNGENTCQSYTW